MRSPRSPGALWNWRLREAGVSCSWLPEDIVEKRLTMLYWKSDRFWLGKLLEHPEIMTQGETIEELEENLKDAFSMMVMDDVPEDYEIKEIVV